MGNSVRRTSKMEQASEPRNIWNETLDVMKKHFVEVEKITEPVVEIKNWYFNKPFELQDLIKKHRKKSLLLKDCEIKGNLKNLSFTNMLLLEDCVIKDLNIERCNLPGLVIKNSKLEEKATIKFVMSQIQLSIINLFSGTFGIDPDNHSKIVFDKCDLHLSIHEMDLVNMFLRQSSVRSFSINHIRNIHIKLTNNIFYNDFIINDKSSYVLTGMYNKMYTSSIGVKCCNFKKASVPLFDKDDSNGIFSPIAVL